MMRELIERFTYRFKLWLKEQREDLPDLNSYEPPDSPQLRALRQSEPIWKMLVRASARVR